MNQRSALRRPRQAARSPASATSGPAPAPGAPQRAKGAPLVLYRCNAFAAWLTVSACTALKLREPKLPPASSRLVEEPGGTGVFAGLRRHGVRIALAPCRGCVGVAELHRRGLTPKPRQVTT